MSQIGTYLTVLALTVVLTPVKSFAQDDRANSTKALGVVSKTHSCKGAVLANYLQSGWSADGRQQDIENMLAENTDRGEFQKCLFNVGFGLDENDPAKLRLNDLVAAVEKKPARPSFRRVPANFR